MRKEKMYSENEKLSVIIAEDMEPARELLVEFVSNRDDLELGDCAATGNETLTLLKTNRYDLFFLDIHFPDMTGIEILEQSVSSPPVIFTTSYDKYAIKAFDMGAIDYLLKPFSEERFNAAVDRAIVKFHKKSSKIPVIQNFAISFKERGSTYLLSFDDIIFINSNGRYVEIKAKGKTFRTSKRLNEIEQKLPGVIFSRINRNTIINYKYILKMEYLIGGSHVIFMNNPEKTNLILSRKYAPVLKEKLGID